MSFAVCTRPIAAIYEEPSFHRRTDKGLISAVSDESLYGYGMRILNIGRGWAEIVTHYGYRGFMREENLMPLSPGQWEERSRKNLKPVDVPCADVLSSPRVQGICLKTLVRGALIEVLPALEETPGFAKVNLLDGRQGYIRDIVLMEKRFEEEFSENPVRGSQKGFSLKRVLDNWFGGSEDVFRQSLVDTAMKYMGTQYRWGGKSSCGIDCSGLTFMTYMLNGINIWRDAAIVEGYPIERLGCGELLKGDLLYFPGHVAMYIGDCRYIHSTGQIKTGGVAVNSRRVGDPDFRADLKDSLYAAGGVRL